jgi:hypothetical protein
MELTMHKVLALSLIVLVGCAAMSRPLSPNDAYRTILLAKTLAESSYTALYRGARAGTVDEEGMTQARAAYDAYETVLTTAVHLMGTPESTAAEQSLALMGVVDAAQRLYRLAKGNRVMP